MLNPPFRLARPVAGASQPGMPFLADACCQPAGTQVVAAPARRRTRLADLDPNLHCSIIGTCMSTTELRKLVPRYSTLDRQQASDVEIHHVAVQLAMEGGPGCKALQKALDDRYANALRQFDKARDTATLQDLWNAAVGNGDIPPAYWAVMTHPSSTLDLRQEAFGEVHMLSHLVGAANRADIRRLVALEDENAALRTKSERQQMRLQELAVQRDATVRELNGKLDEFAGQLQKNPPLPHGAYAELRQLRAELLAKDEKLALHESRHTAAEQRAREDRGIAEALRGELRDAAALARTLQNELNAMEQAMMLTGTGAKSQLPSLSARLEDLQNKRIVYVGGRPSSNAVIKQIVEAAGGKLLVHDGGVEVRKGLLGPLLQNADMVVFPVDCIDHDSMHMLKRVCDRHQVTYHPLRTASVACFLELMSRILPDAASEMPPIHVSRFCLRHG
jgi:hypothetical protein